MAPSGALGRGADALDERVDELPIEDARGAAVLDGGVVAEGPGEDLLDVGSDPTHLAATRPAATRPTLAGRLGQRPDPPWRAAWRKLAAAIRRARQISDPTHLGGPP